MTTKLPPPSFLIVFFFLVLLYSCKKTDIFHTSIASIAAVGPLEEKFFNEHRSADPEEGALVKFVQHQNETLQFIDATSKQIGFPRWDKAIKVPPQQSATQNFTATGGEENYYLIPFVRENEAFVNAAMVIHTMPGDSSFSYMCDWAYKNQQNNINNATDSAENFAAVFMTMDHEVFGYNKFLITDTSLFRHEGHIANTLQFVEPAIATNVIAPAGGCEEIIWVTFFYEDDIPLTMAFCNDGVNDIPFGGIGGGDEGSGPSGDPGGTPTGGGGSSGGTPPPPPCGPQVIDRSSGNNITEPCNSEPGWVPVPVPIEDEELTDANGFYYSRINELNAILSVYPFTLEPCDSLLMMNLATFGSMWQQIANVEVGVALINRIDSINNIFAGSWINPTIVQTLANATGPVVNCDFFPLNITQLPPGYTASSLLEYFRLHISDFSSTSFSPYQFSNSTGSFSDQVRYNLPYLASTGALVSINITGNNGTVIQSAYSNDLPTTTNTDPQFVFSTLRTPLDNNHPVAGNRAFGIYNSLSNPTQYTFYTMGVDRTWDWMDGVLNNSTINPFGQAIFNGGDQLWTTIQDNFREFIIQQGGAASLFTQQKITARPKWNEVEKYLRKQIDLATLKINLGC